MLRKKLFVASWFLLLTVFCAFAAEEAGPATFKARDLWQAFRTDQGRAEQELVGKTVHITGVVAETGMSVYLTPNVRLSDTADGPVYVTCVLPRADTGLLSGFNKGERVTMSGRVYRFSSSGYVVVKQSQRVSGK